jgi:uncharacterized phage infection (PIP) family protein YhgE
MDVALDGLALAPSQSRSIAKAVSPEISQLNKAVEALSECLNEIDAIARQNDGSQQAAQHQMQRMSELMPRLAESFEQARDRAQTLAERVCADLHPDLREVYAHEWELSQYPEVVRLRMSELIAESALLDTLNDDAAAAALRAIKAEIDPRLAEAREAAKHAHAEMEERALRAMKLGQDPSAAPYYEALDEIDRIAATYEEQLREALTDEAFRRYRYEARRFAQ